MSSTSPPQVEQSLLDTWTAQSIEVLRRRWLPIAVIVIAAGLAGYAASFSRTLLYKSTVVAIPVEQGGAERSGMLGQLQGLAALAGISVGGGGETAESMANLRSRQFADRFLTASGLAERICQTHCRAALEPAMDKERLRLLSIKAFENNIRQIEEDKTAGLVRVSIVWPDRIEAAQLANSLMVEANEMLRERARVEAKANLEFLRAELDRTAQVELRQALNRLVERQTARIMSANVTKDFAFRVIDPALPSDASMPESPRRVLWGVVAATLGGLMALLGALIWGRSRR